METINKYGVSAILVLALCLSSCLRVDEEEFYFKIEPTGTAYGHAYVDLGLSVKWATCNVGATAPEGYGDYFAWGEIEPKTTYDWSTYKYGSDYDELTKYCNKVSYVKDSFTDDKTVLDPEDDAARANWGGAWRMPTIGEWEELLDNCTWTTVWCNGVSGYKVTSKINGNSIFLPAAGYRYDDDLYDAGNYGSYWSSSLDSDNPFRAWYVDFDSFYADGPYDAWHVGFYSGNVSSYNSHSRCFGQSVRPVLGE
ncbi:MAG: hypothetical protein ACI30B_01265 [Paludibacteraceae bacterium]